MWSIIHDMFNHKDYLLWGKQKCLLQKQRAVLATSQVRHATCIEVAAMCIKATCDVQYVKRRLPVTCIEFGGKILSASARPTSFFQRTSRQIILNTGVCWSFDPAQNDYLLEGLRCQESSSNLLDDILLQSSFDFGTEGLLCYLSWYNWGLFLILLVLVSSAGSSSFVNAIVPSRENI